MPFSSRPHFFSGETNWQLLPTVCSAAHFLYNDENRFPRLSQMHIASLACKGLHQSAA